MTEIRIDLECYEDEVRETFCKGNCLASDIRLDALENFKTYIDDLEKSIFNFRDCNKTPEDFLRDLKYLYAEMR